MKRLSVIIGLALALLLPSVQSVLAETAKVNTARGVQDVKVKPSRIAVFDLSAADTLTALGVKIDGIPKPYWIGYLKKPLAKAVSVGTLFEPNYEALFALKPDLIIAGGRSYKKVPELKRIAPTVDMTIWGPGHFKQVKARLKAFGEIFAITEKATSLEKQFDDKLAQLKEAIKGKGKGMIVLTNGSKITAFGRNSRFGWLHAEAGIPEAVPSTENKTHGEVISFEFIAKADPDWIFVIDRGAAIEQAGPSAKATLDNALMHKTRAWKEKRIIYLKPANMYLAGGGVQSIMQTMDGLIDAFSKKK